MASDVVQTCSSEPCRKIRGTFSTDASEPRIAWDSSARLSACNSRLASPSAIQSISTLIGSACLADAESLANGGGGVASEAINAIGGRGARIARSIEILAISANAVVRGADRRDGRIAAGNSSARIANIIFDACGIDAVEAKSAACPIRDVATERMAVISNARVTFLSTGQVGGAGEVHRSIERDLDGKAPRHSDRKYDSKK